MEQDLRNLRRLVTELNTTNSSNDKKAILKKHPECKKILRWTYDPFKIYYVTSANLKKMAHLRESDHHFTSIYDLLETLDSRELTGHDAIAAVNQYILENKAYAGLILNILDRNLKTRTDAKLINKVFPGCVPSFDVALANKYDDVKDRVNFQKDVWFASRKLDGVRVITIIEANGDIKFLSRKGKEFFTLDKVKEEIGNKLPSTDLKGGLVFDGEMCIVDDKGNEDFTAMIKLIRRKDFTVPNPKYKIFDVMLQEVFEGTAPAKMNTKLSGRQHIIQAMKAKKIFDGNILDPVEQRRIRSDKDLEDFVAEANSKGWEGLILRKDVPYEGKRSNDMLKVKKFHDMEFTVKDVEMGPIRIIKDGLEVTETMLSAIKVEYKNNIVSVGSGFSIEQRQDFYKHPEKILGKEVTIQYFEETLNEQGLYSLRFPVLKAIYESPRDM
jgi:DNA ligase-1